MDPICDRVFLGAAGAKGESYWYATLSYTNFSSNSQWFGPTGVSAEPLAVFTTSYSPTQTQITSLSTDGDFVASRNISDLGCGGKSIYYNSSSKYFFIGGGNNSSKTAFVSYNFSTKAIVLQNITTDNGAFQFVDDGFAGYSDYVNFYRNFTSYDSVGNPVYARRLNTNSNNLYDGDVYGGEYYLAGHTYQSSLNQGLLGKTSGFMSGWTTVKAYTGSGYEGGLYFYGIDVNAYGIHVCGESYNSSYTRSVIVFKMDSGFNVSWANRISSAYTLNAVVVDSTNGDVYAGGGINGNNGWYVIKFDSNGTLVWQRYFNLLYLGSVYNINIDANSIYLSGERGGNLNPTIIKYPKDGSKLGTFGSLTISDPGYSVTSTTVSSSTPSDLIFSATPSWVGGSSVVSTPSVTVSKTDL